MSTQLIGKEPEMGEIVKKTKREQETVKILSPIIQNCI